MAGEKPIKSWSQPKARLCMEQTIVRVLQSVGQFRGYLKDETLLEFKRNRKYDSGSETTRFNIAWTR